MKQITGNILNWPTVRHNEKAYSLQQVNCKGVYGAGLAKSTAARYPEVKADYLAAHESGQVKLGKFVESRIDLYRSFILLASQKGYGRGEQRTTYNAMRIALKSFVASVHLDSLVKFEDCKILVPYGIGCGLGGGEWAIVKKILEERIPNALLVKLP